MGLFSNFRGGLWKTHVLCNSVHDGRSRLSKVRSLLILAPIKSAYVTSCWWSIEILVLSCTLLWYGDLLAKKLPIFCTPLSFNALTWVNSFKFLDEPLKPWSRVLALHNSENFVTLAYIILTQCQRMTDRWRDRQDASTTASTGEGGSA